MSHYIRHLPKTSIIDGRFVILALSLGHQRNYRRSHHAEQRKNGKCAHHPSSGSYFTPFFLSPCLCVMWQSPPRSNRLRLQPSPGGKGGRYERRRGPGGSAQQPQE
jgi:hypothetical protein